ncbi:MAG: hypothetical protein NTV34_08230 [Proteobacteria bacterium]|nr:hypothetical protein [Pseudomonadota bacterium]
MAVATAGQPERDQAIKELFQFIGDYSRLIDRQVQDARSILENTVENMMSSVQEISNAADFKFMKAEEVLVKSDSSREFISKSAKELSRTSKSSANVTTINAKISAQMAALTDLDQSVQKVLVSIMGALSVDDVVRQRLEHVTTSTHALDNGIRTLLEEYKRGALDQDFAVKVCNSMAQQMYKSYTMEEEKTVFKGVLGEIKKYEKAVI